MSLSSNMAQTRDLTELRNHMKWLDEERRKGARKVAELEQKLAQQGREQSERDQRMKELERQIAGLANQLDRLPDLNSSTAGIEQRLQALEAHIAQMTAQLARLPVLEEERNRLQAAHSRLEEQWRTEVASLRDSLDPSIFLAGQEQQARDLAELSRGLAVLQESATGLSAESRTAIATLREEMEARLGAVELEVQSKLGHLLERADPAPEIERLDGRLTEAGALWQQWEHRLARVEEAMAGLESLGDTGSSLERLEQELNALQAEIRRLEEMVASQEGVIAPLGERLTELSDSMIRAEADLQSLNGEQAALREAVNSLIDENRRQEEEIARQLEGWQATLDENKDLVEGYAEQWLTLSNQYKEARMAVQNFAHWQKQLEQQTREAGEMMRQESERSQTRWNEMLAALDERIKGYERDQERKLADVLEGERVWREELAALNQLIQKVRQDTRDLIWRVQAAQAEAFKMVPGFLLEEVAKVVEREPARPAPAAFSMPARADLSVADAIEQGLITIDYSDELDVDR